MVRQKDIASLLNLSTATVSRALRNDMTIRSTTRAKVLQMARHLGYRVPERHLGAIKARPTDCIGVLIDSKDAARTGTDEILSGISEACSVSGTELLVQVVPQEEITAATELRPRAQGAIVLLPLPRPVIQRLSDSTPLVLVTHRRDDLAVDFVGIDERRATAQLVDLLRHHGHRRIGFLAPRDPHAMHEERRQGYRDGMLRCGLALHGDLEPDLQDCAQATWGPLARVHQLAREGVTAWICASDVMAYELDSRLRAANSGTSTVAICSCEGLAPPTGQAPLTSIQPPHRDLGVAATRRLLRRIERPTSPVRDVLLRHVLFDSGCLQATLDRAANA